MNQKKIFLNELDNLLFLLTGSFFKSFQQSFFNEQCCKLSDSEIIVEE